MKLANSVAATDRQEESQTVWAIVRSKNALLFVERDTSNQDTVKNHFGSSESMVDTQDALMESMGANVCKTSLNTICNELKQAHFKTERKMTLIQEALSEADKNKKGTNLCQRAEGVTMTAADLGLILHSETTEKNGDQTALEDELKWRGCTELNHPVSFPEERKRNKKKNWTALKDQLKSLEEARVCGDGGDEAAIECAQKKGFKKQSSVVFNIARCPPLLVDCVHCRQECR